MALRVSAPDGVKVYAVAGGKNIPAWLSDKKKKALRKDEEYRRRVELLQDFEFPAACQRIKVTPDGQYIFASGYHPPQVRCYDVSQLSMKFDRHLDAEVVDFQLLSDDYSKAAFLCADRSISFHARRGGAGGAGGQGGLFGSYYKVRVPRAGRDLAYCPFSAELLVAASAPEVYRLSLSEGRFMAPLPSRSPAVNACGVSPAHGLLACAGEDGRLECFDLRQRASLGSLDAAAAVGGGGQGLTALRFDGGGMHLAVGTSGGLVALFDLRSQRPMTVKDHMYDAPIVDIKFHDAAGGRAGQHVISADRHIVKARGCEGGRGAFLACARGLYRGCEPAADRRAAAVLDLASCTRTNRRRPTAAPFLPPRCGTCAQVWDADSGEGYTNIEPADADINDVCVWPRSGLVMLGCDTARVQAYFVPSLGPAPKWCSFLESLTEELEESANPSVYDDYRFVTRADLEKLGLTHLVGTPLLKAYMHGFFMDNRLYSKAKSIADPFAYEAYRQKRVQQKLEEERKSRISLVKKLPKVNAQMAARILAEQAGIELEGGSAADKKRKRKAGEAGGATLLEDDRFKAMFEDAAFAIDERSEEYRVLHPNTDPAKERRLLAEHFEALEDQGGGAGAGQGGSDSEPPSDEEGAGEEGSSHESDESDEGERRQRRRLDKRLPGGRQAAGGGRQPRMYAAKDEAAASAYMQRKSLAGERALPLGERAARAAAGGRGQQAQARPGGNKELSFAYFVPSLGPAPKWCSFLESLTEELEESANPSVYDDYRFVTRADLEKLGLTHLVGTPLLKAYMHGFFMDNRLYSKAKSIADPFAYEAYRQKRVQQKLEEERKSRISLVKKLPKPAGRDAARRQGCAHR
eukprot:scaffold18.g2039.t1